MAFVAYRRVLAVPRVRATILMMLIARMPMTAMGVIMTLYVVSYLDRSYGDAGMVGAAKPSARLLVARLSVECLTALDCAR